METRTTIDRLGLCPNCQFNWEGDDIFHSLSLMKVNISKSTKDIEKLANEYGWTLENNKKFSFAISMTVSNYDNKSIDLVECPNCRSVFNVDTGEKYLHRYEAKSKLKINPYEKE